MNLPDSLSVVIPTLNEADNLCRCLDTLSRDPAINEILVVDGGSVDGTIAKAAEYDVRIIETDTGRGVQLDAGWRQASCNIIMFVHADTIMPPGCAELVKRTFQDSEVAITAFRLSFNSTSQILRFFSFVANQRSRFLKLPYGDQCLSVRKGSLEKINGLPHWDYLEDVWLVRRMSKIGKLKILPRCVITSGRRYMDNGMWKTWLNHLQILHHYAVHHEPLPNGRR